MNLEKLDRFFKGKSQPSEAREIIEWIYSDSFETEYSKILRNFLSNRQSPDEWQAIEELRKFKSKTKTGAAEVSLYEKSNGHVRIRERKNSIGLFVRIAAVLALAVVSTIALLTIRQPEVVVEKQAVLISKSTSKGQKSTIFLPDGSRVGLNSNSSITFPEYFTDSIRIVEMTGEAFFEVKSDAANPFIVKTGSVIATAIGTAFNINAMEREDVVVSLVNGRLAVKSDDVGDLYLDPGQEAVYSTRTGDFLKRKFDREATVAWKDGVLIFVNEEFEDVIEKLEMWYGVEFQIVNRPVRLKHYTGKFINESLDNVLQGIGFTNNFSFEIKGKTVNVHFF